MGNRMTTTDNDPSPEEPQLELSPSESVAHNSAMRLSGGDTSPQRTQKALASVVLGFEMIVVVLIGLTIYGLGITEPRELGIIIAGGLGFACVAALAFMRLGRSGIVLGWIAHALMLATGILLPPALIVGGLFTALWLYCMIRGAQIDRNRAAYLAEQR